jgi:hypothetical protein
MTRRLTRPEDQTAEVSRPGSLPAVRPPSLGASAGTRHRRGRCFRPAAFDQGLAGAIALTVPCLWACLGDMRSPVTSCSNWANESSMLSIRRPTELC